MKKSVGRHFSPPWLHFTINLIEIIISCAPTVCELHSLLASVQFFSLVTDRLDGSQLLAVWIMIIRLATPFASALLFFYIKQAGNILDFKGIFIFKLSASFLKLNLRNGAGWADILLGVTHFVMNPNFIISMNALGGLEAVIFSVVIDADMSCSHVFCSEIDTSNTCYFHHLTKVGLPLNQ